MVIKQIHKPGMVIYLIIFVLSACKPSQQTRSPTGIDQTNTAQPTLDASVTETEVTQDAYPAPNQSEFETPTLFPSASATKIETVSAYPPPTLFTEIPSPTPSGLYPYPPPQPTPFSAYPGPETPIVSPQPIAPSPTNTQALATATAIQPTIAAATQTPTSLNVTPSVVPTRIIIRTEIQPTDPSTFQVISGRVQLVELFAFWSPLSRSMAPVVHLLEDNYDERVNFIYLDIDDPQNSLYKGLMGEQLPPVFFLLNTQGVVLNEWRGYVPATELETALLQAAP